MHSEGYTAIMALEKELETYHKNLPRLLPEAGRFVVICGDEIAGVYSAYDDALKVGYDKFGLKPFLVKCIEAVETVQHFTRELSQCRS
jgi:hypothetical protein